MADELKLAMLDTQPQASVCDQPESARKPFLNPCSLAVSGKRPKVNVVPRAIGNPYTDRHLLRPNFLESA